MNSDPMNPRPPDTRSREATMDDEYIDRSPAPGTATLPRTGVQVDGLTLGVVATSRKEDEHRLPIHPRHLERIDAELRGRIFLERGYGQRHGYADAELAAQVGGLRSREQLIAECDIVVLPKPVSGDLAALRPGQVLWGWPHCVQDAELTQIGDRPPADRDRLGGDEPLDAPTAPSACTSSTRTTSWPATARCCMRCSCGARPGLGPRLRAAVISFGATARGAVDGAVGARECRRDRADAPQRRRPWPRRCRPRGSSTTTATTPIRPAP